MRGSPDGLAVSAGESMPGAVPGSDAHRLRFHPRCRPHVLDFLETYQSRIRPALPNNGPVAERGAHDHRVPELARRSPPGCCGRHDQTTEMRAEGTVGHLPISPHKRRRCPAGRSVGVGAICWIGRQCREAVTLPPPIDVRCGLPNTRHPTLAVGTYGTYGAAGAMAQSGR